MSDYPHYRRTFRASSEPWVRTFAWWPVSTYDIGTVWLCPVWRQRVFEHPGLGDGSYGLDWCWRYRGSAP